MLFVGVIRSSTSLRAVLLRPVVPYRLPGPGEIGGPAYRLESMPLEESRMGSERQRRTAARLLEDWSALGEVSALDAFTLARVLRVLLETRAGAARTRPHLPPLDPGEEKRVFRPTAAHPRGYRGTRDRPPKAGLPRPYDLRRWLASSEGVNVLLRRLSHHWPRARSILLKFGYDAGRLGLIDFDPQGALDPYWEYHHGGDGIARPEMPVQFSTHFLPLLGVKSPRFLREALAAFRKLDLQNDPDLLAHVLALLAQAEGEEEFLHACRLLLGRTPPRRAALAPLLARSPEILGGASRITEDDLRRIESVSPGPVYAHRLAFFFGAVGRGLPKDYLFDGFRLARAFEPEFDFTFRCFEKSGEFDAGTVEEIVLQLEGREDLAMMLWEWCGRVPGLCSTLKSLAWSEMPPGMSAGFLDVLLDLRHARLGPRKVAEMCGLIFEAASRLHGDLLTVNEGYREKLLESLKDVHWYWARPGVRRMAKALPALHRLVSRMARPPFSPEARPGTPLCDLVCCASPEDLARLEALPDDSFLKLEEAYGRENDQDAVRDGLSTLSHQLRALTLECLERSPAALLRVAKSLGTLSDPRRDQTIDRFEEHPLRAVRWEAVSPAGALKALEPFVRKGLSSPMPRKLRENLRGGRELTGPQVERCLKVLRDRVPVTLLEVLESLVEGTLAEGVAKRKLKDGERHALRMLPQVKPNRRALRRLLMAHFRGEGDFIQRHPNSRRWFARHPRIDETGWRGGLTLEREIPKLGRVRIAVEREPLEALKLGTYVGSCLGLGGTNAYSAAAVVLDVNKQVLYARGRKGTVLARQLVAISEEEELVCFVVYPYGAPSALKRFFREYDEALAVRLGLKIYSAYGRHREGMPGGYQIARVISTDWWDDGAWEFEVKGPTRGRATAVGYVPGTERPVREGRSS